MKSMKMLKKRNNTLNSPCGSVSVLFRFSPIRLSISLVERFSLIELLELDGSSHIEIDLDVRSETLKFVVDEWTDSTPEDPDTLRSLTVFISFRKAAILSGAMPTVGMTDLREEVRGLMGFSMGMGAGRREARAEAKRVLLLSEISLGPVIKLFGGGGGGGGGGR
jgi:hypothetical protein